MSKLAGRTPSNSGYGPGIKEIIEGKLGMGAIDLHSVDNLTTHPPMRLDLGIPGHPLTSMRDWSSTTLEGRTSGLASAHCLGPTGVEVQRD